MKYVVEFERIGRNHGVSSLIIEGTEDELVDAVLAHCGKYLRSSEYSVSIDLDAGKGWIDAGRFGTFTVKEEDGASGTDA